MIWKVDHSFNKLYTGSLFLKCHWASSFSSACVLVRVLTPSARQTIRSP